MPRRLGLILLPLSINAAIWPPALQEFARQGEPRRATLENPALWQEYGLITQERAEYSAGARTFNATAWQFKDATGSVAAWQWQRPADAKPVKGASQIAASPNVMVAAKGNYLVRIEGSRLSGSEIDQLFADLPGFREPPVTSLPDYLPKGTAPNSERYVLGPQSLKAFLPEISSEAAGLDFGVEIQLAKLSEATLAIFRYPTPQIARLKAAELSHYAPSIHRSGPLVAILRPVEGTSVNARAEAILKTIQYRAVLMENEANPIKPAKDAANMLLSIFALAGILLGLCLAGGLLVGGFRIATARKGVDSGAFQTLDLSDR
ncbi:MAG: DUF6599 family protein [Bryobacteraceae bacterium]|nr:DUF6599 family protein [Bryobacteraceae bacterium]